MAENQYGFVVGAHHVDDAILAILQKWDYTYLNEVAIQSGEQPDELKPFRTWRVSYELEKMPEDQTPVCIIANQGLIEPPVRRTVSGYSGQPYEAVWRYRIAAHVSARGVKRNAVPRAQRVAKMYVLAVRMMLTQKHDEYDNPALNSIIKTIDWIDEDYGGLDSDADRTICMTWADFNVTVAAVTTWGAGPREPLPEPDPNSPTWPVVTDIVPEIIKVPTDETIDEFIEGGGQ